jgi:hypothetical protein
VATLVARNENGALVAPMMGSGGVWTQAVGFVLVRLAGIWLQSPLFWLPLFRFVSTINCIVVQHNKGLFPSNLTGHILSYCVS